MRKHVVRVTAGVTAIFLILGYWLLPVREDRSLVSGSGHAKWELNPGESMSWTWESELADSTELMVYLKGLKKGQGITLTAELKEASGRLAAQVIQQVAELGEKDYLTLRGAFQRKTEYTLTLSAVGDGTISVKGEEDDDGAFHPALKESGIEDIRNPVVLYFALGCILLAMTPVAGKVQKKNTILGKSDIVARILPWGTFFLILGVGLLVDLKKPAFRPEGEWVTWDEEIHFSYAKDLALISIGGIRNLLNGIVTWHPAYLPLSLGCNLGEMLNAAGWNDPDLPYRCGIIVSTFCYAFMSSLAVKHAPRYKISFFLASTCPLLLFQATSMTYDTVVASSIILGIALVLETVETEKQLGAGRAITMTALLAMGTVAKPAYSVALISLFMIPREKFSNAAEQRAFRLFVIGICLWCMAGMLMPGPYQDVLGGDSRFEGANASAQIQGMLADPLGQGRVPFSFLWENMYGLAVSAIDYWGYVGRGKDGLMDMYVVLMLIVSPLCTCGEQLEDKSVLTVGRRLNLGLIAFLTELILTYSQYIASSSVGGYVTGMQPRYFIPLWAPTMLALMWPQAIRKKVSQAGKVLAVIVFALVCLVNVENALIHLAEFSLV